MRSGSSAKRAGADHPQPPRLEVGAPAVGIEQLAAASGSAIALIVKSRAARSAARSSSRSRTRSTCQPWLRATTRQAPNAPESSNAIPPAARATARAAGLRVAGERDVEVGGRAPEQAVADGAADEPGRLAAEALARGLQPVGHRADP